MTSMPNEQFAASLVSLFFSFKGRINRARFWVGTIPLVIGWTAAMALFNWMFMRAESLVPVYGFGIAAGVMLLWGQFGVCIKRLHDRGKSGWWLLIIWALPAVVSQAGQASGGICISSRVHEDVRDRLETTFDDGGTQTLKNIARAVQVWR